MMVPCTESLDKAGVVPCIFKKYTTQVKNIQYQLFKNILKLPILHLILFLDKKKVEKRYISINNVIFYDTHMQNIKF